MLRLWSEWLQKRMFQLRNLLHGLFPHLQLLLHIRQELLLMLLRRSLLYTTGLMSKQEDS